MHETRIGRQHDTQLIPPHALHALHGEIVEVVAERCYDMDGDLMLPTEHPIIHLAGVGVVLAVLVANLALLDRAIKQQSL
ncbi:hypothetical protein D3C81_1841600 [compost metagenome]